jgi:Holliday junction resolvasome RuvABC DNA-binding subunit
MAGITAKTAEKIVVALKDKVESLSPRPGKSTGTSVSDADVFDVLETFGYTRSKARDALARVDKDVTDTSERVRQALKLLGK